jgi:hypothetical protein
VDVGSEGRGGAVYETCSVLDTVYVSVAQGPTEGGREVASWELTTASAEERGVEERGEAVGR